MSSTNIATQLSSVWRVVSAGTQLAKFTASPIAAAAKGMLIVGRSVAFTTMGRAILVICLLGGFFIYARGHFIAAEKAKWNEAVKVKQEVIINKVTAVNTATKQAQQEAALQTGFFSRILGVVISGIEKAQPPHPIEPETIDLINETRGKPKR